MLTTPSRINSAIRKFCATINRQPPIYLSTGHGEPLYCVVNVAEKVQAEGGLPQYGWIIWTGSFLGFRFSAEYHAVWRHPDGHLVDVTAQRDREERILFLPAVEGHPKWRELWDRIISGEKVTDPSPYLVANRVA